LNGITGSGRRYSGRGFDEGAHYQNGYNIAAPAGWHSGRDGGDLGGESLKIHECELCQHESTDMCLRCTTFADKWELKNIYKAAPELLEALKEALPPEDHSGWWCPTCKCAVPGKEVTFEEYHESCGTYLGNRQPETWVDRAREIIKKAEGK